MSMKTIALALVALALTAGVGTVASAHLGLMRQAAATAPADCTTRYDTEIGSDGRSISVVSLTCPRAAQRLGGGAAL